MGSFFLALAITTEAMGIGGLRAINFPTLMSLSTGEKPAKCTSVANEHRRVLGGRYIVTKSVFLFISNKRVK